MAERLTRTEFASQQLEARNDFYAEMLLNALESMVNEDWTKPWMQAYSNNVPQSITGYQYQGSNAFFLYLAQMFMGYELPVYITRDRALKLGLEIKPDAPIEFITKTNVVYYTGNKEKTKELGLPAVLYPNKFDELTPEQQELYYRIPKTRGWQEFNVCNTNMKEVLPELYEKIENRFLQKAERDDSLRVSIKAIDKMIADQSWVCPIVEDKVDQAYFVDSKVNPSIHLPKKEAMIDDTRYYGTLVHEMIHSTKLFKEKGEPIRVVDRKESSYAREELVAELGSAIVLCELGINPVLSKDNKAYLKHWFNQLGAVEVSAPAQNPAFEKLVEEVNAVSQGLDLKQVLAELAEPGVSVSEALRNNGFSPAEIGADLRAILEKQEQDRVQPVVMVTQWKRINGTIADSDEKKADRRSFIAAVVRDAVKASGKVFDEGLHIKLEEIREKGMEFVVETEFDPSKKREPSKKTETTKKRSSYRKR